MKIISWNLRNIATNKLRKTFSPRYSGYGLGGNGLDYITKLVTGDSAWGNINSATPVDIFAVIELKTGGRKQGNRANGAAPDVLQRLVNAMNTMVGQRDR